MTIFKTDLHMYVGIIQRMLCGSIQNWENWEQGGLEIPSPGRASIFTTRCGWIKRFLLEILLDILLEIFR
jgi:hypothetical protein